MAHSVVLARAGEGFLCDKFRDQLRLNLAEKGLRHCKKITYESEMSIHPALLRCSSFKYYQYAHSSRLAGRAADHSYAQLIFLQCLTLEMPGDQTPTSKYLTATDGDSAILRITERQRGMQNLDDIFAQVARHDDPYNQENRVAGSFQGDMQMGCKPSGTDSPLPQKIEDALHKTVDIVGENRGCIAMVLAAGGKFSDENTTVKTDLANGRVDIIADEGKVNVQVLIGNQYPPGSGLRKIAASIWGPNNLDFVRIWTRCALEQPADASTD